MALSPLKPSQLDGQTYPIGNVSFGNAAESTENPGTFDYVKSFEGNTFGATAVTFSSPDDAANIITITYTGGDVDGQSFVVELIGNTASSFLLVGDFAGPGAPFQGNTLVNNGPDPLIFGDTVTVPFLSAGNTYVPCFVRGTRVLTPAGQVAVEHLAIGDVVSTANGSTRPVRWIGRRAYVGPFLASNPQVWPITVREGALADGVPQRDLHVSPRHAFLLDSVLVPAEALVNGVSVVQQHAPAEVEYYHIELDTHDVLLAEGAPAESFMDNNSRDLFQNAAEHDALDPTAAFRTAACAERAENGEAAEAVRRRIAARAGVDLSAAGLQPGHLAGHMDDATHDGISGWACDTAHPDQPVRLEVLDGDVVVARVLANMPRHDVAAAGFSLRSGFDVHGLRLDPVAQHTLRVRRASDGAALGAPVVLQPLPAGPGRVVAFEASLRATAAAAKTPAELERTIAFLTHQVNLLHAARRDMMRKAS